MSEPYRIGKLARRRSDGSKYWSYCIIWGTHPNRKRVSLGTTDQVAAKALAAEYWGKLTVVACDTVGEIIDAFLDTLPQAFEGWARPGVDPALQKRIKDAKRKREAWKAAQGFWADKRPGEIKLDHTQAYMDWRKRAVNTMRHELAVVKAGLAWAGERGDIATVPKITMPAMPDSAVEHLSKPEFRAFLEGCAMAHVRLFAILAVTTGARATALLQLRWEQVDLERRRLDLNPVGFDKKQHKPRALVPLNDRAMEALQEAKANRTCDHVIEYQGGPIASIKKGVAAASERSKVKAHPHMFRHSAAVWMAEDRVPMEEIAAFLGHKNISITIKVYARYHPDYLGRAARSLDW